MARVRRNSGRICAFGLQPDAKDSNKMMPSLLKYFTVVGGVLFAGLIGLNALLDPGGPGPTLVKAEAPPRYVAICRRSQRRLGPTLARSERAASIETWRNARPACTHQWVWAGCRLRTRLGALPQDLVNHVGP